MSDFPPILFGDVRPGDVIEADHRAGYTVTGFVVGEVLSLPERLRCKESEVYLHHSGFVAFRLVSRVPAPDPRREIVTAVLERHYGGHDTDAEDCQHADVAWYVLEALDGLRLSDTDGAIETASDLNRGTNDASEVEPAASTVTVTNWQAGYSSQFIHMQDPYEKAAERAKTDGPVVPAEAVFGMPVVTDPTVPVGEVKVRSSVDAGIAETARVEAAARVMRDRELALPWVSDTYEDVAAEVLTAVDAIFPQSDLIQSEVTAIWNAGYGVGTRHAAEYAAETAADAVTPDEERVNSKVLAMLTADAKAYAELRSSNQLPRYGRVLVDATELADLRRIRDTYDYFDPRTHHPVPIEDLVIPANAISGDSTMMQVAACIARAETDRNARVGCAGQENTDG